MDFKNVQLEFCVELSEVSLTTFGSFSVVLSLQSSDENQQLLKDVSFEVDDSPTERGSANAGTVEILKGLTEKPVKFQKKILFHVPKGSFQSNKESSLLLLVDVLKNDDEEVKYASSRVPIFQSFDSLSTPDAENVVKTLKKNILNLTSKLSEEEISVHAGRIIWSYVLKAIEAPPTPEPSPIPSLSEVEEPTPEEPLLLPPPPLVAISVANTPHPAPSVKKSLPKKKGSEKYRRYIVSNIGKEEVIVHIHAASGIPRSSQDSNPPIPYVAGTTKTEEAASIAPQHTTSIATQETCFPTWEDTVVIEINEEDSENEVVLLLVMDLISKRTLISYSLPVVFLKPFHQYHLDLIQEGVGYETHLFVSVLRRTCRLPIHSALAYTGVEVTLCSLGRQISNMSDPLMAVVRIVPNYYALRKDMEVNQQVDDLYPRPVQFPPQDLDFTASNLKHSNPQVSLPLVNNDGKPNWQQQLLFCEPRQMASTFTAVSALIIEYYSTSEAFDSGKWNLKRKLGYSAMLLNKHVFNALRSDRGRQGIRVENLSIKESSLETMNNHVPSVNIILRLITEEHPRSLLNAPYLDELPRLETFSMEAERPTVPPSPSPTTPPRKTPPSPKLPTPPKTPIHEETPFREGWTPPPIPLYKNTVVHSPRPKPKLVLQDGELPPLDAIQNLLPDPQRIILDPDQKYQDHPGLIPTRLPPKDLLNDVPHEPKSKTRHHTPPDRYAMTLLDHQQRELDNYKSAMKRMSEEIVKLQDEVTRLEVMNSKLRQQVNMHEDATKALLRDSDLAHIPRNQLIDRYVSLREKLSSQVRDATSYRDKLLQLQNELIRHNDREKEFLNLQEAHSKQSAILQRLQEKQQKIKKLEETCRKQEEIIEKMEKMLKAKLKKEKDEASPKFDAREAFLAENARLRSEINQIKNKVETQQQDVSFDDAERMELYSKLDRSDGRIRTLERAVRENARKWGQEKEELLLRLNEQGFRPSLPPVNRSYYRSYEDEEDIGDRLFPKRRTRFRGRYGSPRLEPLL